MHHYLNNATGVTHNKLYPKTRVMARYIFMVYILLTAVESALLMADGMGLFDAVCHSMPPTATGVFSTKHASIAYWHSVCSEQWNMNRNGDCFHFFCHYFCLFDILFLPCRHKTQEIWKRRL